MTLLWFTPAMYNGLVRQTPKIEPDGDSPDVWAASVQYGPKKPPDTGDSTYQFDTAGGTQHITQSLQTLGKYAPPGKVAPDFKGAIGVTHDNVEGVDITVPVYNFSETHYIASELVTLAYKATLFSLTGKVNKHVFRGFAPGEVLFVGASGAKRGEKDWEITWCHRRAVRLRLRRRRGGPEAQAEGDPEDRGPWTLQDCYQIAGIVGVDPRRLSLLELVWMADGAQSERWDHTAVLRADLCNQWRENPIGKAAHVVGRDPGQFAERTQTRVDRREQEARKTLLGGLIQRLLILRAERLQPGLCPGLLEPFQRIADALHCLGPVEGRQNNRQHAALRRRTPPGRVPFQPLPDVSLRESGDGTPPAVAAQVVEPTHRVIAMPLADRAPGDPTWGYASATIRKRQV